MKIKLNVNKVIILVSFLILSGLMVNSFIGFSSAQEITVYKSAAEYDYPPFSVVNDGEADGFSVELLKAVGEEMGLVIDFKVDHWHVIKKELEEGRLDLLPLVGYSEERDEYFDFTVPYIVMQGNIFVRKDYKGITSEEDLTNKEIIVMRGDNSEEYAREMGFTEQLILVDTYSEAFELLSSGKHDAVLAQSLVGHKIINNLDIKNVEAVSRLSQDGLERTKVSLEGYEQKFSFAVKEGNKELLASLNEGLAIVSENGTYETLYMKWFPFLVDKTINYRMIFYYFIAAVIAVIITALLISYSMIKKEVNRKTSALENNLYRNTIMFKVMNQAYSSISDWLDYVLNEMIKMTGSEFGYIYLVNEETKELVLNSWSKGVMKECHIVKKKTVYQLDDVGIWGEVIRQRKPMIVNNFRQANPLKKGYPKGHVQLEQWMAVPVFENDKIVATVGLANKSDGYDDNDIYQITTLMSGVWNMIERFKYREALKVEKNKYFSTLLSIGDAVMVVGLDENIEMINKVCAEMTGWTEEEAKGRYYKDIFRLSSEGSQAVVDPVAEVLKTEKKYEMSSQTILKSKEDTYFLLEDSASPIKDSQNNMLGVVLVFRDVTEKQKQKKLIEYLSFHDVLTELYNRRFFEEEMSRLDTSRNYPITIIMGDLNGLKLTNDAFGHYEGDKLLKRTADLFRKNLRADDIAARWGGDEFAVLMPKTTSKEAEKIVQRINQGAKELNMDKGILSIAFGWATKTNDMLSLSDVFKNAEEFMYKNKISESPGVHDLTIKTIMKTLFEKSPREREHSQGVTALAIKISKALKLPQHRIDEIAKMAFMHDIGKINISLKILDKTDGLTKEEFDEMKKHPATGYRMLSTTNDFSSIAKGVLHHHERWDGKGYPDRLKGDEIPIESRIIAIAEAFDAMTSPRSYIEKALTKEGAKKELQNQAGTQFDPEIIKLILKANIL